MRTRHFASRVFYAPLRATEAAVSRLYVLSRYAENLSTSYSVKTRKPSRYRQLTAARMAIDLKQNGKAPPPSPASAVPKAPSGGKGQNAAKNNFADDFMPPPRPDMIGGKPDSYSRWAWLDYVPG